MHCYLPFLILVVSMYSKSKPLRRLVRSAVCSNETHQSSTRSVHVGGSLMETYVLTCGARQHRRNMKKMIKQVQREDQDLTIPESDALVKPNRSGFYLHVLHTLHHRGSSVKVQMFHMSMLWKHKGVSRSGIQLMSHLDLGLPLRTLDDYRERETARQTEHTRYVCSHLAHIL